MNIAKEDLGTIIMRVIGIYALIRTIELATPITQMLVSRSGFRPDQFDLLFGLIAILPMLCVGIWFLASARSLGRRLVGSPSSSETPISVTSREWEEIALSVMGFYLLFNSIPKLVHIIGFISTDVLKGINFTIEVISFLVVVMIGFGLILRAKGIISVVRKLRSAS